MTIDRLVEQTVVDGSYLRVSLRAGADRNAFLAEAREWIAPRLGEHGAILFRDFGNDDAEIFQAFTRALAPDQPSFFEESSPRSRVVGAVHTSTDYPAQYPIQMHNEYSYSAEWPMKLFFGCLVAAQSGGATPIADCRKVLARLPTKTRERFEKSGVLYVRKFTSHMGVPWERAFQSNDKAVVERYCREVDIDVEWLEDGGLRTRQRGSAILEHPRTREPVWFNHAFFFNVRAIEPQVVREMLLLEPEDELLTNTYYGDGAPIEEETIEALRAAYREATVAWPWRRGDTLLVDNMLTAHGRQPYSGDRKVVVVMAEACRRRDLLAC